MKLNFEDLYRDYLRKVKLDERKMAPAQRTETKRAFAAGVSSLLVAMQEIANDPTMTEQKVIQEMKHLQDELTLFWGLEE